MRRPHGGFTLIELLLSLSIFSIMAIAVYSAFAGGVGVWRRAQAFSATYQTARLVLEEVAQDLRNAVVISGSEFIGEPQRLSFLTVRHGRSAAVLATRGIRRVTYEIRKNETEPLYALFRLEESYVEGLQDGHREPDDLASPIMGFDIQYASEVEGTEAPWDWQAVWEEEGTLPIGVQITLTIPGRQGKELHFTKTIFIPQGHREEKTDEAKK